MSRCFPYPPPGYEKNGIRDQALIESIKKHQKEGEKAKKEKKERKREKKEKDKRSSGNNGETEKNKHRHKKEKRPSDVKDQEDRNKKRNLEAENLEKSNLTEEHGQPVDSQNSSESTLNSNDNNNNNKRLKPTSPQETCRNSGSKIRIRLPLQRHRDHAISLPSKEQPFPSSARVDDKTSAQRPHSEEQPFPASARVDDKTSAQRPLETPLLEQPCSTSTRLVTQEARILSSKSTAASVPRNEKQNHNSKSVDTFRSQRESIVPVPGKGNQNHSARPVDVSRSNRDSSVPAPGKEKQNHSSKSVVDTSRSHRDSTVAVPRKEIQNESLKPMDTSRVDSTPTVPAKEKVQKPVEAVATTSKENNRHSDKSSEKSSKSSSARKRLRLESKHNDLFLNWVPTPLLVGPIDSGDEGWLFESNQSKRKPVVEPNTDVASYNEPSSLWPQARFLPEADIFALPYSVPY